MPLVLLDANARMGSCSGALLKLWRGRTDACDSLGGQVGHGARRVDEAKTVGSKWSLSMMSILGPSSAFMQPMRVGSGDSFILLIAHAARRNSVVCVLVKSGRRTFNWCFSGLEQFIGGL